MNNQSLRKEVNRTNNLRLLQRILKLASPYRFRLIAVLSVSILIAIFSLLTPYLVQYALDHAIIPKDYPLLVNISTLLLSALVINVLLSFYFIYQSGWLGLTIINNLRVTVFDHIQRNSMAYFDTTPVGTNTTRTINDIEAVNEIFSEGILNIISDILTILAIIIFMFITSWQLTLVSLSVLPVLLIAAYLFKEGVRKTFQEVRNQITRMNTFLQEHIGGMLIVQLFGAEERELKKFNAINLSHKQAHIKSIFYYSVFFPVVEIIASLALGAMLWYWAGAFLEDKLTLGQLNAFIICINMLFRPIRMLADKFNTLQMGLIAAERVFSVLDNKTYHMQQGKLIFKKLSDAIVFDKVNFSYLPNQPVLNDVSFSINKGETLAVVGATGSGKSTIISLLCRFYDIQQGSIYIDSHDIKEYNIESLRQNMAVVHQDVFLFSGTIMENITMYQNIPEDKVYEAARFCGADEFILQLPGTYQFKVMERGNSLSMGQRQLISIVRAILQDPQLLILDEATASIDTFTERLLQHAIETVLVNRTSIIIAHRLSTIQKADKILVLDKARVAEFGTHNELITRNGHYAQLYKSQFVI